MKGKSILEGLVVSVPLFFGGADFSSYPINSASEINSVSISPQESKIDPLTRFKFAAGLTIFEGLCLYMGYQVIKKSAEYRK